MKKRMCLLLGLLLLLTGAACGERQIEALPYDYNTMTRDGRLFCDTGDTVLLMRDNYLLEYDKEQGTLEFFCKDASCDHLTTECPAGNAMGALENYHGQISMLRFDIDKTGALGIYISQLKNGRFEMGNELVIDYIHAGGHLYVRTPDGELGYFPSGGGEFVLVLEETAFRPTVEIGEYIYGDVSAYFTDEDGRERGVYTLSRLKTGDPEAVPEPVHEHAPRTGGGFRSDGAYLYYNDEQGCLMRSDLDGGNEIRMTEFLVDIYAFAYDGEYLYFSQINYRDSFDPENGNFYRMKRDGSAPPELLAHFEDPITEISPAADCDYFFVYTKKQPGYWMLLDKDGTNLREIPWV